MTTTDKKTDFNSSINQRIKEKFVHIHVKACVTNLVEFVLSNESGNAPFSIDEIENYYSYPEYIGEYAKFSGGTEEQINNEIEELQSLETEPQEVSEWWIVSSYLGEKLNENGYPVRYKNKFKNYKTMDTKDIEKQIRSLSQKIQDVETETLELKEAADKAIEKYYTTVEALSHATNALDIIHSNLKVWLIVKNDPLLESEIASIESVLKKIKTLLSK